jgi:hypothetical protein
VAQRFAENYALERARTAHDLLPAWVAVGVKRELMGGRELGIGRLRGRVPDTADHPHGRFVHADPIATDAAVRRWPVPSLAGGAGDG